MLSAREIVLFDGHCGFCDGLVRWLIERDPAARLCFAPLQGETAAELRIRHPDIPQDHETVVFVQQDRVYLRSEAAFRLFATLDSPWRHVARLGVLPRVFTDWLYRGFARVRYRIFGRLDACPIPSPEEAARFLP